MAEQRTSAALKIGGALLALAVVAGGAFLVIANVPTGGRVAIAAGVIWWIAASAFLGRTLLRRRPGLRTPVRATLALAAAASIAAGFVVTRGKTVDEEVVRAAPETAAPRAGAEPPVRNVRLLSGRFRGESGHDGEGDAAVVRLAEGGRVLTFTRFDVDPGGGGLRVYLHAGRTTSDDLGDFVEIARLKGTRGNQQYAIPRNVDLGRYDTVVIWCVPFTTRIAQAPLG